MSIVYCTVKTGELVGFYFSHHGRIYKTTQTQIDIQGLKCLYFYIHFAETLQADTPSSGSGAQSTPLFSE